MEIQSHNFGCEVEAEEVNEANRGKLSRVELIQDELQNRL